MVGCLSSGVPQLVFAADGALEGAAMLTRWLAIIAVLALVLAATYFWQRRARSMTPGGGRKLRWLETLPVGPREKLVLVELNGRQVLVGVTAQQISVIAEISQVPTNTAIDVQPTTER